MNNMVVPDEVTTKPDLTKAARIKVEIDGVVKSFPSGQHTGTFVALSDVSLNIADGEFVSLLGPSGCGKSTLLEIVAGLQTPSSGEVRVDGEKVMAPGPDRTVMFQHYALFPWRTARDNVAFPMEMANVDAKARAQRAMEYLRIVGLEAAANRFPSQLSGGMQQRVALARALACEPKVLLMDEPFSGADAITREILQEHLLHVQEQTEKTILFVTHSVDEAIRLSDRIIVMGIKPGRIVQQFTIDKEGYSEETFVQREDRLADLRETLRMLLRQIMNENAPANMGVASASSSAVGGKHAT